MQPQLVLFTAAGVSVSTPRVAFDIVDERPDAVATVQVTTPGKPHG
ncbi:hypothetical protein BH09ACT6_BH09ACT6_23210 [soil metagenome]